MIHWIASFFTLLLLASCAPLRTVPQDEKHQWELKLHEVQSNFEGLRHDISGFQTELQILEGRIKYYENALSALKQQDLEHHQKQLQELSQTLKGLQERFTYSHQTTQEEKTLYQKLSSHANETSAALIQFKARLQELEGQMIEHTQKLSDISSIKTHLDTLVKSIKPPYKLYRVRPGDSLEKIAALHKTKVEKIKALNELNKDLIVVGQELKIPSES